MVQQRNIAMCIILSLVTCGIYGLYWLVCLNDDANRVSGQESTSGAMLVVLSLVTCGIYMFYWMYKQGEKIDSAKRARGMDVSGNSSVIYLVLTLFGLGIVSYALMQNELNQMA